MKISLSNDNHLRFVNGDCRIYNDPLILGQQIFGGTIGYFFNSGDTGYVEGQQHGIIITNDDVCYNCRWGNASISISTSTLIGQGYNNTVNIVAADVTSVANLCYDLSLSGYTDWFLPSKDELYAIYLNKNITNINNILRTCINCSSSTQYNTSSIWVVSLCSGNITTYSSSKSYNLDYIRACRYF